MISSERLIYFNVQTNKITFEILNKHFKEIMKIHAVILLYNSHHSY